MLIGHLNKASGVQSDYRTLGSVDIAAIDKNYSMSIENNYISKNIKFGCEYPLIMLKYKYQK